MVDGRVPPVDHIRSTLVAGSVQTLRAKGYFEPYVAALPKEFHAAILEAVAGSWMPIEIGMAHYGACDALGLSPLEQFNNGREVSVRVQGTLLGLLARTAKSLGGVTPWLGLEQFQRMWDRVMSGGSGAVYRTGPKEARVESHGNPMVKWGYFRNSWRGMVACAGELFCEKLYVTDISPPGAVGRGLFVMRVAWV
jgi:hypothetical protein